MGFAAGNAQHVGSRPEQQDAFGFSDPSDKPFVAHGGFLGVVADGVGGLTHGSEASRSAVRTFLHAYHVKSPEESIPDALARSFLEANRAVLQVASSDPSAEGAGTTLVAAVLHEHALYWISAGDSRIYLLHGTRLTRVTSDHTYARELDEQAAQGLISRVEAQNHSERGSLTSYLGQPEPKEIDRNARPLAVQPNDCVILCTDGFYRGLNEIEITDAFRGDLQRSCDVLVRQVLAKHRKQQDNLTIVALKHSSRSRKTFPQGAGYLRSHLRLLVLTGLILVLLAAGARYWYEKHSTSAERTQEPVKPSSNSAPDTSANGNATNTKQEQTLPAAKEEKKPQHTAKVRRDARNHQEQKGQEPKPQSQDSTEPKTDAGGTPPSVPAGAQQTAPEQTAPADGTVPAVSQPASPEPKAPPTGQPTASDGKTPPSGQAPGSSPQKQPPPPPPAPETKPDAPNRTLGKAFGLTSRSGREDGVRELSWELEMKDGKRKCHS